MKAINKMINLVIISKSENPDKKDGRRIIGNIVLEMRKDLLGKTNLSATDFSYTDVIEHK